MIEDESRYEDNPWQTYPPKPEIKQRKANINQSIISLLLFIVAFYFFLGEDLELVLILAIVVLIHELGHLAAMKLFGYKDLQMLFIPLFGAMASGKKKVITQNQRAIILLGGPVPGIIIGAALYYLHFLFGYELLLKSANIFVLLNAFNLIPVTPLDGGRLIEVLFFANSKIIQLIFSLLSALLLVAVGIYSGGIVLMLFGGLMLFGLYQNWFSYRLSRYLGAQGYDLEKDFDDLSAKEYWDIRKEVISSYPDIKTDPAINDYSPQESKIISLVQNVLRTKMIKDLGLFGALFYIIIWAMFLIVVPAFCIYYYSSVTGGMGV